MNATALVMSEQNPVGLGGIDFVELAGPDPERLHQLLLAFGFSRTMRHADRPVDLYEQHDIRFLINRDPRGFAGEFSAVHGPSIVSMGWRVGDGTRALAAATARGAKNAGRGDHPLPAIFGIGDSLIYFSEGLTGPGSARRWRDLGFVALDAPELVPDKGFVTIDHLTNNVYKGTMQRWAAFYREVFGFREVRYFDIRGHLTGLTSFALRSPCGSFCIPINEADEQKSQINEYLDEYRGPGVQHLAFLTRDILASLQGLEGSPIEFLDIESGYYDSIFTRVPNVRQDHAEIRRRSVLVDGDEQGYLLQIFTRNLIGPIFIEIIQRENHLSFGEGNFGALFRSIERDQARRGVFSTK
jgi:4-hydroxyphenylpyruvate dioxygenase